MRARTNLLPPEASTAPFTWQLHSVAGTIRSMYTDRTTTIHRRHKILFIAATLDPMYRASDTSSNVVARRSTRRRSSQSQPGSAFCGGATLTHELYILSDGIKLLPAATKVAMEICY